MGELTIATFYHFAQLDNYQEMRIPILNACEQNSIKGTILLAKEGMNSTIAGTKSNLLKFFEFLKSDSRLSDLSWRESSANFVPFQRLKIRLKQEIVRLADNDLEVMHNQKKGEYIEPEDWGKFIACKDVKTIDVRNIYETKLGGFHNAIDPCTLNFRDFAQWVEKWVEQEKIIKEQKIAMYCTGGVRCEKSTAHMKKLGFQNVYHLKGGVFGYFEKTKNKSRAWWGNCFVFDDRVAVDDNLNQVKLNCISCDNLITTDDLKDVTKGKTICSACDLK